MPLREQHPAATITLLLGKDPGSLHEGFVIWKHTEPVVPLWFLADVPALPSTPDLSHKQTRLVVEVDRCEGK